jgi:hypothetical protein
MGGDLHDLDNLVGFEDYVFDASSEVAFDM